VRPDINLDRSRCRFTMKCRIRWDDRGEEERGDRRREGMGEQKRGGVEMDVEPITAYREQLMGDPRLSSILI
jgi:hypothetical protein